MSFSPCSVSAASDRVPSVICEATRSWQRGFCRPILAIGALLIGGTTWAKAGTFIVFGPQDYQRGTGAPVAVTTNFSVLNPNTQYTLKAFNGGLQDDQTELVSNGFVTLNGVQVLGSNNFNQQVAEVDVPVILQGSNTLAVQLRGRPGGVLTIEIVGVDNDPPTIQATAFPAPNAAGWNNSNVTVSLTCSDGLSGVASCPSPITVTTEGANQAVSGTATDAAGNSAATSITVNLDKTPPGISITSPANGATLTSSSVSVNGFVSDALSGVAVVTCDGAPAAVQSGSFSCSVTLTQGSNTITAQANDVAGNTSSVSENVSFSSAKIVYASGRALDGSNTVNVNRTFNIWSMNPDGSGQTALTTLTSLGAIGGGSFLPVWSPGGKKIGFESAAALDGSDTPNTDQNIWVMNADGSSPTPLTSLTARAVGSDSVAWSPDGSKIAYRSSRAVDGSDKTNFGLFNI